MSSQAAVTTRPTRWEGDGLMVDIAFPGGNLLVDDLADGILRVRQDRRDTPSNWFHWAFRLQGAAGRRIEVRFGDGAVVGVRGPAISYDEGRTWRWLDDAATTNRDAFTCTLPTHAKSVRFSMGIPHQQADWEAFISRWSGLHRDILCRTRHGRGVEATRIDAAPSVPWLVMVTARHHCCEAMAGYALEGLVQSVLAESAWRQLAELVIVPFVDLDGVEEGDQGKGRQPHDHNRDYQEDHLYPETAAIRNRLAGWAGGRRVVALDLHCPWIAGQHNQEIYQVGAEDPTVWAWQRRLAAILERDRRGPLPYLASSDLAFGLSWNVATNFATGTSCVQWTAAQPQTAFASSIEVPYADARGVAVLPAGARAFGADLAAALRTLLTDGSTPTA